ncbi:MULTISPECIES: NAD-dependent epimerase/dehydratase family protein [Chryseobacterium]|uniref:Dihydroflavonol-4-reductase n=1 Tax=Chryseobacterium camelliae TaxID=1265445 RepID=A0ABU0TIZ8_9FLAO|nr:MULTISPECIES: NAD-dependent epimerase/dehydratase family protein [Chryseobacterium]MDT3409126.1 dihydroflavonol-4-reductase [Pseudacidovorax intermedius]MDQ1097016.1 dihydroflavonol-4-reductase [Chryseobacterium camelliae]MDQ1100955.1 dihydroflavonol-4-reductase [Chryseobacterium sp. SORGH_AS_1048]MDR6084397.1 dihydroflavonol-4-reductase [Chryseobacterium sp. SORGH_AS_0909]MDR6132668.1 dihydroflavonol-4-reductase [Chryseobacterium sp. SORGH_AS_1175]
MVLVTGATGILGRVVVLELLKRGKKVRAAKRSGSNLKDVKNSYRFYTEDPDAAFSAIEWVELDFDDLTSLQTALEGVEEVYHCAAKVSFNPKYEKEMYHINIKGTTNLLYACEQSSVKKFLYISTIAVLDGFNEEGELDEGSDFNAKEEHSAYAISKHMAEMEVWRASAEGLQIAIINPGMIIGSGGWNQSSGQLFSVFENNRFTFPGGSAYVDVRDVAEIAAELMDRNIFGERFIAISGMKKYEDIGKIIRKRLGLKEPVVLKKRQLGVGRIVNVLLGWLIPPLRMVTKSNIASITSFNTISNQKIKDRLNFRFIPVDESLEFHLNNYINDKKS